MTWFRPSLLITLLLALALVGGTVGRGMAEGREAARALLVEMVICSDTGARKVLLDRSGAPVPAVPCDAAPCLMCLVPDTPGLCSPVAQPAAPRIVRDADHSVATAPGPARVPDRAQARAPPTLSKA